MSHPRVQSRPRWAGRFATFTLFLCSLSALHVGTALSARAEEGASPPGPSLQVAPEPSVSPEAARSARRPASEFVPSERVVEEQAVDFPADI